MQKQRQEITAATTITNPTAPSTRTLSVYASVHGHAQAVIIPRPLPKATLDSFS